MAIAVAPGVSFQLGVESLPNGVLVVGSDGRIVLANQQLGRQFGYTAEELVGQLPSLLLADAALPGGHVLPQWSPPVEADVPGSAPGTRGVFGRRKDGTEFPIDIGWSPLPTAGGVFLLGSIVDVTWRRELEATAKRTLERQLMVDRLVAELSFKFINLPSERVGAAIQDAVRQIGEALDVDRCTFFRIREESTPLIPIGWHRQEAGPAPTVTDTPDHFPWVLETLLAGKVVSFSTTDEIPNAVDRTGYRSYGIRSAVTVPLSVGGRTVGAIGFNTCREDRSWDADTVQSMCAIATAFSSLLARAESDGALRQTIYELEQARDRLHAENVYLRRESRERHIDGAVVGQSPAILRVLEQLRQVAATDSSVLLLGETGTGKELLATRLHEMSARHGRLMVRVNCSAIPATLIESELFGREKGAFTGALARQIGRFELADHSTIFLDEIGDLPAEVQVKLLRVLEERRIERLGSPKPISVDVRIVAATHRNLEQLIAKEAFREDLFYRLNVFPIHVPPLRERVEDIPLLVWRFVDEFTRVFGKRIDHISRENMAALQQYSWPGNIRELRNILERAMIVAAGPELTIALPTPSARSAKSSLKLADVEKEHIRSVLESTGWRIRGATGAANCLGLRPTTLETRMAKLGLVRPRPA